VPPIGAHSAWTHRGNRGISKYKGHRSTTHLFPLQICPHVSAQPLVAPPSPREVFPPVSHSDRSRPRRDRIQVRRQNPPGPGSFVAYRLSRQRMSPHYLNPLYTQLRYRSLLHLMLPALCPGCAYVNSKGCAVFTRRCHDPTHFQTSFWESEASRSSGDTMATSTLGSSTVQRSESKGCLRPTDLDRTLRKYTFRTLTLPCAPTLKKPTEFLRRGGSVETLRTPKHRLPPGYYHHPSASPTNIRLDYG